MKITIITATYNSGYTVVDTIESILRQTYKDVEYLVIDGASTDNTMDVVRDYESRFNGRLRYVSEPDKGIYDAMNKGLRMATGDVVGILNSDDFYTSDNVLERIAAEFGNPCVDAVYGDIHFVNAGCLDKCVRYYSSQGFKRWMMRLGFMPAHPSFYCKREMYSRHGGFDCSFRVAADFENLLRLIFFFFLTICYISVDCVTMRTGGASTAGMMSHRQILWDHLRAYRKNGIYSNIILESFRYVYKIGEITVQRMGLTSGM